MSMHMSIHMSIHMGIHMSIHMSVHMSIPMSLHMSMHMSMRMCTGTSAPTRPMRARVASKADTRRSKTTSPSWFVRRSFWHVDL